MNVSIVDFEQINTDWEPSESQSDILEKELRIVTISAWYKTFRF